MAVVPGPPPGPAPTTIDIVAGSLLAAEGDVTGAVVGNLTADGLAALTWSLIDSADGRFVIDAKTGQITVGKGLLLDYEQAQSHQVTVRVSDGQSTHDETFVIRIVDVDYEDLAGSPSSDFLVGGANGDRFWGMGGDDRLIGGGGADTLRGGAGDDIIYAGAQDDSADLLFGGDGDDVLGAGVGNDTVEGNAGSDLIFGGTGDDVLYQGGGTTNDASGGAIWCGVGSDLAQGDNGNDTLGGGAGNDTLSGEGGGDLIFGGAGADRLDGGDGADTLWGGIDNDVIRASSGGGDQDIDVIGFAPGSGSDLVFNFETIDVIDLRAFGTSWAALNDGVGTNGEIVESGFGPLTDGGTSDALINLSNGTLIYVADAVLTEGNFIF